MKSLQKFALASLRQNKKRSIATIIGVALSCALVFTIIAMATSIYQMVYQANVEDFGNYHEMYQEVPGDKVSVIENFDGVKQVWYSDPVDFSKLENLGIYNEEFYEESVKNATYLPSYYTLRDHLEDSERSAEKRINVFVKYDDPNQQEKLQRKITDYFAEEYNLDINVRTNTPILILDGQMTELERILSLTLILFVGSVIIIASVFMIRNSFQISMMERLHQFGIMSSLGARPRQIRRTLYLEAAIIALIAIPLGIIIGLIATSILILIVNNLLGDFLSVEVFLSVPPLAILVIVIVSLLIVYLSSASAAIIAGRMSPIDAIRNTNEIKINKKQKIKTSKFVKSYFGIGGVIASNNLKRSRKRYSTTVLSIVISVAVFIGFSTLVDIAFRELTVNFSDYNVDYYVMGGTAEVYDDIISQFKPKQAVYYSATSAGKPYARELQIYDKLSGVAREYNIYFIDKQSFEKIARSNGIKQDFDRVAILVKSYSESHSDGSKTLKTLDGVEVNKDYKFLARVMSYKNVNNGDVPDIDNAVDEDGNPINYDDLVGEDGTFIGYDDVSYDIRIAATTVDAVFSVGYEELPYLIVSQDYYQAGLLNMDEDSDKYIGGTSILSMETGDNNREITKYINNLRDANIEKYPELYGSDLKEQNQLIRNVVKIVGIFLYSFIAVISLIGLTNIFNTISTNVILRAKEFAMLKSVGMTTKEFNRMIKLESFFYSFRALIIGIPIGLAISYGIYYTFSSADFDVGYHVPFLAIILSIVVVGIMVSLVMLYGVHEISKQNIIETIRKDSI